MFFAVVVVVVVVVMSPTAKPVSGMFVAYCLLSYFCSASVDKEERPG